MPLHFLHFLVVGEVHLIAHRILVFPDKGLNSCPLQWKLGVLTTEARKSLLHVCMWFESSFLVCVLNNIPWYNIMGHATVYLFIHSLKDILVDSKLWQ